MIDCPIDSPCRDCEFRSAECHGVCKAYKQYKIDVENWKKAEKAKRRVWQAMNAYEVETIRRNYKRKYPSRKPGKRGYNMLDKSYLVNELDLIANQIRQDENGLVYVRGVTVDGLREMLIDASTSLQAFQEEKREYLLKLDAVVTAFLGSGCKHA